MIITPYHYISILLFKFSVWNECCSETQVYTFTFIFSQQYANVDRFFNRKERKGHLYFNESE